MILTAIAVAFGLSVVVFALLARSAPVLNEDGTFIPARSASLMQSDRTSSI
jgi:hypothetical protein